MRVRWLLLVLLGLMFVASGMPAYADCFESCQNSCRNLSGMVTSQACVDTCSHAYCEKPKVSYGAIAYGPHSTANGYAFGKSSAGEASRTAMANCAQNGDDCKVVTSFSNSCAAVAAVEDQGRYATGQGDTRDEAQSNALAVCKKQGKGECEIEAWTCATP
jgi:hypothetical protein